MCGKVRFRSASNGTELKNYGVSEERWGWRREGEQSRIEEYSEFLPISPFSPSHHFYTLPENGSIPMSASGWQAELRASSRRDNSPVVKY
jgi:hypothetical protein